MASVLHRALNWRWTPFYALAAASGVFAIGVASLLPDGGSPDEKAERGAAAASLSPDQRNAKDRDGEFNQRAARVALDDAAARRADQRRKQRERRRAREEAKLEPTSDPEPRSALTAKQREALSFTRPAARVTDNRDAPEEQEATEEAVAPPTRALAARLSPGALRTTKLMNRLDKSAVEEAEDVEEAPEDEPEAE